MSIIELTDATFTSCKFINTGITEGKYGRHAPRCRSRYRTSRKTRTVNNIHFEVVYLKTIQDRNLFVQHL